MDRNDSFIHYRSKNKYWKKSAVVGKCLKEHLTAVPDVKI